MPQSRSAGFKRFNGVLLNLKDPYHGPLSCSRCTGYRPILDAFRVFSEVPAGAYTEEAIAAHSQKAGDNDDVVGLPQPTGYPANGNGTIKMDRSKAVSAIMSTCFQPHTNIRRMPKAKRGKHRGSKSSWVQMDCIMTEISCLVASFVHMQRSCQDLSHAIELPDAWWHMLARSFAPMKQQTWFLKLLAPLIPTRPWMHLAALMHSLTGKKIGKADAAWVSAGAGCIQDVLSM